MSSNIPRARERRLDALAHDMDPTARTAVADALRLMTRASPVPEPKADHPEWWPSATPETFLLQRNDQPKLRIKGWWLGNAEGQSRYGSDAEANLYLTESGKTIVQVRYVLSGKCYLTWGATDYVIGQMEPLPWAKQLVIDKGVDSWEDFE